MTPDNKYAEKNLVLAAEDFNQEEFAALHRFSSNDERVIAKLIAHGPVLLQGSRGSGKSALMREASRRLQLDTGAPTMAVYLSLRYMPLLRSVGDEYQRILCQLVVEQVERQLAGTSLEFEAEPNLLSIQGALTTLSEATGKRIVLMFDDAAHIGREASLADFFDVFRTLSNSSISCKATIYPGVTNFGTRFDVFNDATVVDVVRDDTQAGFTELFREVLLARFPDITAKRFSSDVDIDEFARFVGKGVLGNMRGFIFACNSISNSGDGSIGLTTIGRSFIELTTNYYWPLLDEVEPKLGKYKPVVRVAREIAEAVLADSGRLQNDSVIVHRDILARLGKAFEILEYVGFISKREASKAMKSGGRGTRYALNLCMLLEHIPQARLTSDVFNKWTAGLDEALQLHSKGSLLSSLRLPDLEGVKEPEIMNDPIDTLRKSATYPYGLSDWMLEELHRAGIHSVQELYEAPEDKLDEIKYVGESRIRQMKNVVSQAIWL